MTYKWLIDADIRGDRVVFTIYNEGTSVLEKRESQVAFRGYIAGRDPHLIATELESIEGVESTWIEKWRVPPYYEDYIDLVVFETSSYKLLLKILKLSSMRGLKVINKFPHPLIEALHRLKIKPLTILEDWRSGVPIVYDWIPSMADPDLNYIVIDVEHGYYTVKTRWEDLILESLEDILNYISSHYFHLGFTDQQIYLKLIELDSKSISRVSKWITGGAFHPSEYFEWSRLSYTPLSLMGNITIGRILSTIEALKARSRRLAIDTVGRREPWRTIEELIVNDRGGVVYRPKPGLYWSVCQIDFKSLYPNIIAKYNISGETIDKSSCKNPLIIPWTPHKVCLDERGVVPESIEELIKLKEIYEDLLKETGKSVFEYRRSAIKWILVASFGYLGYRNSLFGSVMAHEVVTATSREIMMKARMLAESLGYKVIHAIVDSVFIEGVQSIEDCEALLRRIEGETGFKAKVEAYYTWLYIPRDSTGLNGVSNRYYGLLSSGGEKVKGIMAVRRDTPLYIARAQIEALRKLFEAKTPSEMEVKIREAHSIINLYIEHLKNGLYDKRELIISRRISIRDSYKKPPSYIIESTPPYMLIYTSGKLAPYNSKRVEININKYKQLLEKARKELPTIEDINTTL
ncbi:MAG: DNA polymerase domain-containing protein [Acidilobaceae archaeon]